MPPHLCALPLEVAEQIAHRVALLDLLGPPSHLVSLLAAHPSLNSALSIKTNSNLYASIFRAKFDYRAPGRRLSEAATRSPALANQLKRYCLTLKNIRRGDKFLLKDFYRAFCMCSENDGRNAEQLQWAGLAAYVERYVFEHLWDGRDEYHHWPVESGENAFALWLYWYSLTPRASLLPPSFPSPDFLLPEKLASYSEEQRAFLQTLLRPYAVYSFRYPPFLAPDNHFHLPLNEIPDSYYHHSTLTPHGYYPQYREPSYVQHTFTHYDERITIAEPPIGLVAKLLYVALVESQPQDYPSADLIPVDRAEADALGVGGPTVADYEELNALRAARPPERGDWDWRSRLSAEDGPREDSRCWSVNTKSLSARQENDWERWRGCFDPWANNVHCRGVTYSYGSLNGLWGGRYLVSARLCCPSLSLPWC